MLQDLYPHIYHNEMAWKAPAPDDYALIFAPDGTVYCDLTDGALTLPRIRDVGPGEVQYAFSIDEAAYYLVAAHPDETDAYSWWSYRAQSRARNVGWRIDYFIVSERLRSRIENADILPEVMGSDHCPVMLELKEETV